MIFVHAVLSGLVELYEKLKIELPYDPAIPLLRKIIIQKDTYTPMFMARLLIIART